jgi:hypothetical protein
MFRFVNQILEEAQILQYLILIGVIMWAIFYTWCWTRPYIEAKAKINIAAI